MSRISLSKGCPTRLVPPSPALFLAVCACVYVNNAWQNTTIRWLYLRVGDGFSGKSKIWINCIWQQRNKMTRNEFVVDACSRTCSWSCMLHVGRKLLWYCHQFFPWAGAGPHIRCWASHPVLDCSVIEQAGAVYLPVFQHRSTHSIPDIICTILFSYHFCLIIETSLPLKDTSRIDGL